MATYYLKNTSGNTVTVTDLGLMLPTSRSLVIDSNAINGYLTSDMAAKINDGSLILSTTDIGDNGGDMSIPDAISALTLVSRIMRSNPTQVTFTQAVDADPLTDITAAEAETLTDGSDAGLLHKHDTQYWTKVLLEGSNPGTVKVNWENIINAPTFGAMQWIEPVKCNLHGMDSNPPSNPQEGWFYVDTDDNHIYKYVSGSWVDQGAPVAGDRVIYRDGTGSNDYIYEFDGTSWGAGTAPVDNWSVLVDDDGDGHPAQYCYANDEVPPDWIRIADVNWGDHSVLSNRSEAGSHPASAISYNNSISGLTATSIQDAIDEIAVEQGVEISNILFVAQNGNDSFTGGTVGTLANPFATIQGAIASIPTTGQNAASSTNRYIIYVMPGDYVENVVLSKSWVYLVGVDKKASRIKSSSGNTLSLSSSSEGSTGIFNIGIVSDSSTTTDNAILVTGNNPIIQNVDVTSVSGARGIYISGAYNQSLTHVLVKNGEVRIDAGIIKFTESSIVDARLNVTNGTIIINDGDFSYAGGNAIEQSNGTVYLVSAKLSSGSSASDYSQTAGTVYWGWVEYNPSKVTLSGTKILLFVGKDLFYDNTASGLSAHNVQDAIDALDGRIDTAGTDLTNHIGDHANPHQTTLHQAITADAALDANVTVTNLTSLVNGSDADVLHKHDADNIGYSNTTSGMTATNVQSAINELDSRLDTAGTDLTDHINDQSNPHLTTLTQAITADAGSNAALTVSHLNTLVTGVNADALHVHDAGAVTFDPAGTGLSSTNVESALGELKGMFANTIGKGTAFPTDPAPDAGDIFYRTDLSLFFQYDGVRNDWLSIAQMFLDWGSASADGVYLNIHGAAATQTGYLMPRNGKIISITARCASGNQSKALEIRRNHNAIAPLKSFSLSSGQYSSITEDINFVAGDYIQAFAVSNSISARDIVVMVTICWTD